MADTKSESFLLEKIRVAASMDSTYLDLKITKDANYIKDSLVYRMEGFIWGKTHEIDEISYPDGWFQGFKEAYIPKFILKIFPVKFKIHNVSFRVLYPEYKFFQDSNLVHQQIDTFRNG